MLVYLAVQFMVLIASIVSAGSFNKLFLSCARRRKTTNDAIYGTDWKNETEAISKMTIDDRLPQRRRRRRRRRTMTTIPQSTCRLLVRLSSIAMLFFCSKFLFMFLLFLLLKYHWICDSFLDSVVGFCCVFFVSFCHYILFTGWRYEFAPSAISQ